MIFLRAPSEAEMLAALSEALPGLVGEDGTLACYTHGWALDFGIPIVSVPAVLDEDGEVVTPAVMDERFHCNLILLDDSLTAPAALIVAPGAPQRVFA